LAILGDTILGDRQANKGDMNGSQRQVNLPRLLIFFTTKMGVLPNGLSVTNNISMHGWNYREFTNAIRTSDKEAPIFSFNVTSINY
jgi:hypothetical protein